MTRLPLDDRSVVGYDGPRYTVSRICAVSGCSSLAEAGGHHIWRRSFLVGAYDWVKLPDGRIVGNKIGLCTEHHMLVTTNKVIIQWDGAQYLYGNWDPLSPQPPVWGRTKYDVNAPEGEPPEAPGKQEECPTCHRKIPHKHDGPREEAKERKAWTISVPMEERENGADVLDTLLRECAILFAHDEDNKKLRYHTLALALALVVQNGHKLMSDE